jgi:hypothetical protein
VSKEQKERAERSEATKASLQGYADVLASVILASRMVHGVTVAISMRNPAAEEGDDDAVIMAANTSTQGAAKREQIEYALLHLNHLKLGSTKAIEDIQNANQQAEAASKGRLN